MIRKLPFMLIALCFLLSCGGDPLNIEPDPLQPEKPYIPEEPDPFQGYLVKNREGFDVNSINILHYNEDSTFLTGFRNEKLWVALFNKHTSEQLHEWNGAESFDRTIDIDLGYGEHDIFETIGFSFSFKSGDTSWGSWFCKTSWGYAFTPSFRKENEASVAKNVFLLNGDQIFVYDCEENILMHSNWYQNSIVVDCEKSPGKYEDVVISPNGEYIMTLHVGNPLNEGVYPLSYTDGLYFNHYREKIYIERLSYTEGYSTEECVWATNITPSLMEIERDARVDIVFLEQNDQIWKFQVDITNYDGSKEQVIFTVDVESGEVTEI